MSAAMLLFVVLLSCFAVYLSLHRMFQVDEAQNIFMIRVLATDQSAQYFSNALLWMLGPMSWLVGSLDDSIKIFELSRLIFVGIFLLNVYLIAINTGRKLNTFAGVLALFGAATLAPLWDYGFEIRHDNLILTGLLLMWWLGRVAPRGRWSYVAIGCLTVAMPLLSFKAIAYAAPTSLAFLAFPPPGHGQPRATLLLAWLAGAAAGALLIVLAYLVSGAGPVFIAGLKAGVQSGASLTAFDPQMALGRIPRQMPLVQELALLALCWTGLKLCLHGRRALSWDSLLPEALLCLGSVVLLLINPTPFPYNLVNVVPFAYLLAFRFAAPWLAHDWKLPYFGAALLTVLLLGHLLPFVFATSRHLAYTNTRQKTLMRTAEIMTDARKDRVYDAIGMVPTRASIGYHWYLHSLNKEAFASGAITPVSSMLAQHPAAVFIKSYRTNMLTTAEWEFVQQRYVPLADDFWVLGQVLPAGGGNYQVLHGGRYVVMQLEGKRLVPLTSARIDGRPVARAPVQLAAGPLRVACAPEVRPVVVWVGPVLDALPVLAESKYRRLFINFY